MAIHETKKQSDIEKRLKILRQQIYGKERVSSIKYNNLPSAEQVSSEKKVPIAKVVPVSEAITHSTKYLIHNTDISYLYQDLAKIGILATFALAAQIILFYLLQNNLLKNLL